MTRNLLHLATNDRQKTSNNIDYLMMLPNTFIGIEFHFWNVMVYSCPLAVVGKKYFLLSTKAGQM